MDDFFEPVDTYDMLDWTERPADDLPYIEADYEERANGLDYNMEMERYI